MILGFIVWWPLGLAILAFLIGSGHMGCWTNGSHWEHKMTRMQDKMDRMREQDGSAGGGGDWWGTPPSSGNHAFDEYRTETLRAARRGAARVPRVPRAPALCPGPRRVRPVHGRAPQSARPGAPQAQSLIPRSCRLVSSAPPRQRRAARFFIGVVGTSSCRVWRKPPLNRPCMSDMQCGAYAGPAP